MVADKSKFDSIPAKQPSYGDIEKNNLDTSPSSSSDESLKSKREHEERSEQSLGSSIKSETSDDGPRIVNNMYLCSKPAAVKGDEIDHSTKKDQEYPNLTVLKTADSTVEWNHSSTSYKQNLYITQWSDLKLENLSMENSLPAKEMDEDSYIMGIRKCLVDYQELRGVSREEYTFSILIRVMGQATGRCLFALFYVIVNIVPAISEIFLHVARFVLDKMIDIKDTENSQQMVMKTTIFIAQIVCIYICLVFLFGFIVWPVIRMAFGILTKIMLYD